MNIKKEIIDSIITIVDATIKKTTPTITFGLCTGVVSKNKCTIRMNQIDYNLNYYGNSPPVINRKYPVFIPFNNMSLAFITTGESDKTNKVAELPIGSVYFSTNNVSPEITLGYGLWNLISSGELSLGNNPNKPLVYAWERVSGTPAIAGIAIAGFTVIGNETN